MTDRVREMLGTALYLHLRHAETPLERLIREGVQMFTHRHTHALNEWEAKAKREIHAMAVARTQGLGQIARNIRVRLMVAHDYIPNPYDPDYRRVIQAINARYIAAFAERDLIDNITHSHNHIFTRGRNRNAE